MFWVEGSVKWPTLKAPANLSPEKGKGCCVHGVASYLVCTTIARSYVKQGDCSTGVEAKPVK